jgi:hypothetical protein
MGTGFITNLFWGLTVEEFIYDSMKWIVIGGLGFTASEQFSKTKNDKDNNTKQDTNDEEPIDYYSDKKAHIFKLFRWLKPTIFCAL